MNRVNGEYESEYKVFNGSVCSLSLFEYHKSRHVLVGGDHE